MSEFIKYWALGTLISVCLGLYGCGNDSVNLEDNENEYALKQTDSWKTRCIDDNEIRVEEAYINCRELTPHFDCETFRLLDYEKLAAAWSKSVGLADADLESCLSDFRVNEEFCVGTYNRDLSFYVGLYCDGAI